MPSPCRRHMTGAHSHSIRDSVEPAMEASMKNEKFVIEPHFRLQEWVADEKGYFRDEGLDYVFRELVQTTEGAVHDKGDRVGAYQSFEQGRKSDISCACHWTVDMAAAQGHGKLYP